MPSTRAVGWSAFAILLAVYSATLAPSVTWWDSGELITAAHSLGIPHPPGTALYVLVAKVWSLVVWPLDFAVRVNLLSAVATAGAVALLAAMLARWTRAPGAAFAAALTAGAASSVWRSANEAEVYAMALLGSVVILWAADRAGSNEVETKWRWVLLCAYLCGLAYALHLAALVAVPAAIVLIASGRPRVRAGRVLQLTLVAALGASAVLFLIVRAQHDPWLNQGNPDTWSALADVLRREQYSDPGFWRRQAPLYLQVANWFEYADWQFALGLHPSPPPSPARTSVTILFVALGMFGAASHRALDRRSWRAMAVLFATASLGVILYLNLKAGPSFGEGVLPDAAPREARERDYFFATSFVVWGLWAGFGAVRMAGELAQLARQRSVRSLAPLAGIAVAASPLALNWTAVDRRTGTEAVAARDSALALLSGVPPRGVLLTAGDNDTYPLWYAQRVNSTRQDVTVVTIPLLGATWYRQELARRQSLLSPEVADEWQGLTASIAEVCRRARDQGRPIRVAPKAGAHRLAPECHSREDR